MRKIIYTARCAFKTIKRALHLRRCGLPTDSADKECCGVREALYLTAKGIEPVSVRYAQSAMNDVFAFEITPTLLEAMDAYKAAQEATFYDPQMDDAANGLLQLGINPEEAVIILTPYGGNLREIFAYREMTIDERRAYWNATRSERHELVNRFYR